MDRNLKTFLKPTNSNNDFVGLHFNEGKPEIYFPIGYYLNENYIKNINDKEAFKDIITLIKVLNDFKDKKEGLQENKLANEETKNFPINAYIRVIEYYISNGYYKERETEYKNDSRGKINWKRTVQNKTPYMQEESPVYINFIVRKNRTNENTVITEIHKYCVAVALYRIGFLYGIDFNLQNYHSKMAENKAFLKNAQTIIADRLNHTNNDKLKILFSAILKIISDKDYLDNPINQSSFGTNSFNIVWEKIIDRIFGNLDTSKFNPKVHWTKFVSEDKIDSEDYDKTGKKSSLKIDSLMRNEDEVFILDAKYYQIGHLPGASDINKQITYGDSVFYKITFNLTDYKNLNPGKIYNAFILPNNLSDNTKIKFFNEATSNWKISTGSYYETVKAIYFDTKTLLNLAYSSTQEKETYKENLTKKIKEII